MQKVHNSFYDNSRELKYEISIKYYENGNLKKAVDSTRGNYSVWNENIICSMEGIHTLMSKDYYVSRLENQKELIIGKNNSLYDAAFVLNKWDSIFDEQMMEIKKIRMDSVEAFYRVITKNKYAIDSIDMQIDIQNYFLKTIIVYYNQSFRISKEDGYAPVIKFNYRNYSTFPVTEAMQKKYLISNYVTINKKQDVSVARAYAGYNIINNLKFQKQ
jgi:hypothetical protein